MTTRIAVPAAALLAAAVVAIAQRGTPRAAPPDTRAPAIVSAPAAPGRPAPPQPSPLPVARRALRWQLAAEAGRHAPLPARTFTPQLARELVVQPPAVSPRAGRIRVMSLREQAPVASARRVLATVRGPRAGHITVLVICRPRCLVASIE